MSFEEEFWARQNAEHLRIQKLEKYSKELLKYHNFHMIKEVLEEAWNHGWGMGSQDQVYYPDETFEGWFNKLFNNDKS